MGVNKRQQTVNDLADAKTKSKALDEVNGISDKVDEFHKLNKVNYQDGLDSREISVIKSGTGSNRKLVNINDWDGDVDDPSVRLYGTYDELRNAGVKDGHHIVQDASVREVTGYKKGEAPAIQAEGPSTKVGSEHYNLTYDQSHATTGGTYGKEKGIGINSAEKNLGLSQSDIKIISDYLDDYFCNDLGLNNDSPIRIPGNRHNISE